MGRHRAGRRPAPAANGNGRPAEPNKNHDRKDKKVASKQSRGLLRWRSIGLLALRAALVLAAAGVVAFFVLMQILPLPEPPVLVASTIYGRNDEVVARLYVEDRIPVTTAEVPEHLPQALVAVEDFRFYRHAGVDFLGIGRATLRNLTALRIVEGASTITQQVARTLYLNQRRTYVRKIQEAILALKLEQQYDKPTILEMYMNLIYLGHGSYGVEVASRTYFGKGASDLTLAEAALIAGVARSPENYTPYRNPELALRRRSFVLTRMVDMGFISAEAADEAREEPLGLAELRPRIAEAPYFVDYVLAEIAALYPDIAAGIYHTGHHIYTTLDLKMQRAANTAMATQLTRGDRDADGVTQPQAALVAVDPQTGYILAMIGGRSYRETQLNRAAQAHRQPGSAFKPFLYAALLDRGYTVVSQMTCEPVTFPAGPGQPVYEPKDYGTEPYHNRPMTMREAVKISDNVAAVRWTNEIGPSAMINYARRLGINSPLLPYLPIALGSFEVYPLEMAAAYAPFANGGFRVQPLAVRRIVAPDGTVVEDFRPQVTEALDPRVAFLVTSMLRTVMGPGGTGGHLGWTLSRPSAGKTGTTSDSRDAWFMGYIPEVVCAVYVGYDKPQALWAPGGRLAGPIWAEFIRLAMAGQPATAFPRPPGIVDALVCTETWLAANATCPTVTEVFIQGTQPTTVCPIWHADVPPPGPPPGDDDDDDDDDDEPGWAPGPGDIDIDIPGWRRWFEEAREAWQREGEDWPLGP
jgi:penicillin-binding protein 2D